MPVLHRDDNASGFSATSQVDGRELTYQLTVEGVRFLTELLGHRDGDEFRPADLQLLIERGWAVPVDVIPEPLTPKQPAKEEAPEEPPAATPPAGKPKRSETAKSSSARRTRGREIALQVLYLMEQNSAADPAEIQRFIDRRLREPQLKDYARALVDGVRANQPKIDTLISEVAENWRLDRMAAIDRNILRLGAYEMLFSPDVPRKVAINEALELAKRYSTAQSSRFVNGILDRLPEPGAERSEPKTPATEAPTDSTEPDGTSETSAEGTEPA